MLWCTSRFSPWAYFVHPCTSSLGQLVRQYNTSYHFYADDSQLYITFKIQEANIAVHQMEEIVAVVKTWMCSHYLKMNNDKTEFLVISSKPMSRRFSVPFLQVGDHQIIPTSTARNIGVIMDSHASMLANVSSVCQKAYIQVYNISRSKKYLDHDSLQTIIHAFITSRLDYCNSLFVRAAINTYLSPPTYTERSCPTAHRSHEK